MRAGCSTMSQVIQSTGRFGRYGESVGADVGDERIVARPSPFSAPLSTAVTRTPRCASCHVQPPGAAPRSTARMPGRSRSGSRSPRNVTSASASFSVERDGAPPGIRSRGIPIGHRLAHGATLAPTYACAPSVNSTCRFADGDRRVRAVRLGHHAGVAQDVREPRRERPGEARQLLAVVGVRRLEPERGVAGGTARARQQLGQRNLGGKARDQCSERCDAIRAAPRRPRVEQRMGTGADEHRSDEDRRRALECGQPASRIEAARTGNDETPADRRIDDDFAAGCRRESGEVGRGLGLEARAAMRNERGGGPMRVDHGRAAADGGNAARTRVPPTVRPFRVRSPTASSAARAPAARGRSRAAWRASAMTPGRNRMPRPRKVAGRRRADRD